MRNLYIALSSFMISVSFTSFAQQKDQRGGNCEQTKSQHEYFCTRKGDPAKDDIMTTANIACNNAKRNMAPPDRQLQKIVSGAGWCGVMICSKFMCIEGVPMTNEVIFSLKIEQELHAEFMAEAEALQMSDTQSIHNFMREFIQRQPEPRLHDLLKRKVEAGRKSMQADLGCSNEDVEALFVKRRDGAVNG